MNHRILVVEDDLDLAEITKLNLEHAGYDVSLAHSYQDALALLQDDSFDLILLDILLPDENGDALCRKIRDNCVCPIIFMSCLDDSGTIISALKDGGDDYVVKPVNYGELLARIQANIRRVQCYHPNASRRKGLREFKQFSIDTIHHKVLQNGSEVVLSPIEYALLEYMTAHPDTLLLYNDLYHQIWKNDSLGDIRTVMVHISNLRKKIDLNKTGLIETVRGAGYIFSDI